MSHKFIHADVDCYVGITAHSPRRSLQVHTCIGSCHQQPPLGYVNRRSVSPDMRI